MGIQIENYITFFLMAIISAVSLYGIYNKRAFQAMILHPASVLHRKEYYRVVSSALVHHNFLHLGLNLFMIYVFLSGIEETTMGTARISVIIIIVNSLVCGSLLSLYFYRKNIDYSSVGASSIVFGCLCSFLMLKPFENHLFLPLAGAIPNIYTSIVYVAIMLIYSRRLDKGKIDYSVHFGGGLGGLITTILIYPNMLPNM